MLDRRKFLTAALFVAAAAPAIVRASSLMPMRAYRPSDFITASSWWSNVRGTDLTEKSLRAALAEIRLLNVEYATRIAYRPTKIIYRPADFA